MMGSSPGAHLVRAPGTLLIAGPSLLGSALSIGNLMLRVQRVRSIFTREEILRYWLRYPHTALHNQRGLFWAPIEGSKLVGASSLHLARTVRLALMNCQDATATPEAHRTAHPLACRMPRSSQPPQWPHSVHTVQPFASAASAAWWV